LIFLESPHRLLAGLADLQTSLGDRQITIARELTKVHEQIWRGSLSSARSYFAQNEPRGEFTLVVAGNAKEENKRWTESQLEDAIVSGLQIKESASSLARRLAQESGWERKEIYYRVSLQKQ
jgi:16S rRNA (cytidine1402-2'-O)-methyltransferase